MKTILFKKQVVTALLAVSTLAVALPSHADISNRIDAKVVSELVQSNVWVDAFDDEASNEGKSILALLDALEKNQGAVVAENVFSFANGQYSQQLYRVKIAIARAHRSYGSVAPFLMKHYADAMVHAIRMGGIKEFDPIVSFFKQQIEAKRITLVDLSPSNRSRLALQLGSAHGISITDKEGSTYAVNGLFHEDSGTFGVDISRPVSDNLITFAHEIVHVGHPDLLKARAEFSHHQTAMQAVLQKWSQAPLAQFPGLVKILSYELSQADLALLQKKMKESRVAAPTAVAGVAAPTVEEEATIRAWADSLIAVTVASEFHAYGLSLSLFARLKDRLQLLPPSPHMRRFLNALMTGDSEFARMFQYQGLTFAEKREVLDSIYNALNESQREKVTAALNRVEGLYVQQFDAFVRTTSNRYSSILQASNYATETTASAQLPEWARPGGFDSPTNPYAILLERVSTSQIYRLKKSLNWASTQLQSFNSTLLNFRTGIVDFSDVSLGELKLMGLASSQATLPSSVQQTLARRPDLMADLNMIPQQVQRDFQSLKDGAWCRTSFCTVSSQSLISRYVALRLMRANFLANDLIPLVSTSAGGGRAILDKLESGFVEQDLTPERIQILKSELIEQQRSAALLPNQVQWMRHLLFYVVNFHGSSNQVQLSDLSGKFDVLARRLLRVLSDYGHDGSVTPQEIESQIAGFQGQFYQQLKPFADACSKTSFRWWSETEQRVLLSRSGSQFRLGDAQFPLTALCHNGQLHLVRQPGDYMAAIPTIINNGRLVSSLLVTGQPVELIPAATLNPGIVSPVRNRKK